MTETGSCKREISQIPKGLAPSPLSLQRPTKRESRRTLPGGMAAAATTSVAGELREPSLEALFAAATASAKREHAALETNEAWAATREVLALLAQAQGLLLEPELRRCTEMQHRRKRPCAVRFACYDLASLDHPSSRAAGSQQLQLFEVLLQLRAAQQRLLRMPLASARVEAVRALCVALRDQAHGPPVAATPAATSAASAAAARFYAAGFDALLDRGVFLMGDRLGEELSSLSRFHLRCVFDRWGGLPRPIDIQASKWHELRFYQPREKAGNAPRRRATFSAAAIAAAEASNRPPLRVTLLNADGYALGGKSGHSRGPGRVWGESGSSQSLPRLQLRLQPRLR